MSFVKNFFPLICAGAIIILLLLFRDKLLGYINNEIIQLDGLFSAVFDWSAIQTGFLFTVFSYIAGKTDGFLAAIRNTKAMSNFTFTLKKAMAAGFILAFTSMPMIVYPLRPDSLGLEYIILSVWLGLFVWAFSLFCLVAYKFGVIIKVPDNRERLAR